MDDFWCGVWAGLASRLVTSPLDLAKIRLQVQGQRPQRTYMNTVHLFGKVFRQEGGIVAWWKGNVPGLLFYAAYTGLQFQTLHYLDSQFPAVENGEKNWYRGMKGAVAALTAHLLTYPLDSWRTRSSLKRGLHLPMDIVSRSMYAGVGTSIVQTVPYMAVVFEAQHRLQRWGELSPATSGFLAGLMAKAAVLPLDVAKRRQQLMAARTPEAFVVSTPSYGNSANSLMGLMGSILRVEGWRALFAALPVTLVKAAVTSAVTFQVFSSCSSHQLT
jgi:hypothetical protein